MSDPLSSDSSSCVNPWSNYVSLLPAKDPAVSKGRPLSSGSENSMIQHNPWSRYTPMNETKEGQIPSSPSNPSNQQDRRRTEGSLADVEARFQAIMQASASLSRSHPRLALKARQEEPTGEGGSSSGENRVPSSEDPSSSSYDPTKEGGSSGGENPLANRVPSSEDPSSSSYHPTPIATPVVLTEDEEGPGVAEQDSSEGEDCPSYSKDLPSTPLQHSGIHGVFRACLVKPHTLGRGHRGT